MSKNETDKLRRQVTRLKKKIADLKEVLTPFILHGRALGALERDDIATVVSKKGHSYLTLGAFRLLMEEMPFEELRK